jgi:hypothetical protein
MKKNSSGVDKHVCVTVFYFSSRSSNEITGPVFVDIDF